jgi:hypothetical protein
MTSSPASLEGRVESRKLPAVLVVSSTALIGASRRC